MKVYTYEDVNKLTKGSLKEKLEGRSFYAGHHVFLESMDDVYTNDGSVFKKFSMSVNINRYIIRQGNIVEDIKPFDRNVEFYENGSGGWVITLYQGPDYDGPLVKSFFGSENENGEYELYPDGIVIVNSLDGDVTNKAFGHRKEILNFLEFPIDPAGLISMLNYIDDDLYASILINSESVISSKLIRRFHRKKYTHEELKLATLDETKSVSLMSLFDIIDHYRTLTEDDRNEFIEIYKNIKNIEYMKIAISIFSNNLNKLHNKLMQGIDFIDLLEF